MSSNGGSSRGGHPGGNSGGSSRDEPDSRRASDKSDSEQALFWAAVSGIMAVNGQGGSDHEDSSSATLPPGSHRDSSPSSPRSDGHSEDYELPPGQRREMGEHRRPSMQLPGGNFTGSNSFCFKLASILVRARAHDLPSPFAYNARLATLSLRPTWLCALFAGAGQAARRAAHRASGAADGRD
jgi:hypothetical protein